MCRSESLISYWYSFLSYWPAVELFGAPCEAPKPDAPTAGQYDKKSAFGAEGLVISYQLAAISYDLYNNM